MTRKERRVKHTHLLERVEGGRSQDMETKRASKRETLTSWQAQRGEQVMTQEQSERSERHSLSGEEGGTSKGMEREASERYSLSRNGRVCDKSRYRKRKRGE